MECVVPKRNKSVKFSPGTSEDGSEDEAGKHASRIRKPARAPRPGHLSIQHGLSNAHLVLRRYAALDGFGVSELSDDEQEIIYSPKVAPAQPVDRYSLTSCIHVSVACLSGICCTLTVSFGLTRQSSYYRMTAIHVWHPVHDAAT